MLLCSSRLLLVDSLRLRSSIALSSLRFVLASLTFPLCFLTRNSVRRLPEVWPNLRRTCSHRRVGLLPYRVRLSLSSTSSSRLPSFCFPFLTSFLSIISTNLYNNVTVMFPDSQIWITGHSLGGGIAALLGTTFGVPVVAFESPGDKLAAARLHLPQPPGEPGDAITHVFHTAGECFSPRREAMVSV